MKHIIDHMIFQKKTSGKESLYMDILLWAHKKQESGFTLNEILDQFKLSESEEAWVKKIFFTTSDTDRKFFELLRVDDSVSPSTHYYSLNEKGITATINYRGLYHAEKSGARALMFAGVSMFLSFVGIVVQIDESRMTEFATRGDRLNQVIQINKGISFCKENPMAQESMLYNTSNGKLANCDDVRRIYGENLISEEGIIKRYFSVFNFF